MINNRLFPDFIFESSWEVCNKVGGIYTVLSTRAKTLQRRLGDNIVFIGPDVWGDNQCPYFVEDAKLFSEWREASLNENLRVKVGRWQIPGQPVSILVDFKPFFDEKDDIYGRLWEWYHVDSLHAYGDYDEASMFSYAAAKVVESFHAFYLSPKQNVIYHANEWMTALGLLYIQHELPSVATVFTTHATSIGRSIAGNGKPLYDYFNGYNGDQMAYELNMQSKHSIEKQTALNVDCFTTVSEITADECRQLLDKPVDCVLPNGFDNSFVPNKRTFESKRKIARNKMLEVANALLGTSYKDAVIVSTSGRYEFRNKGIDVFIESMHRLNSDERLTKDVLAFVEVPAWVAGPREDLLKRMADGGGDTPLDSPVITHNLHNADDDKVLNMLRYLNMHNAKNDRVKLIFVPCYLDGRDGVFNLAYYDMVLGNDLCVYPSYYEPWGYTPLEAMAFHVPCVTTTLAGYGKWAQAESKSQGIASGVAVIKRGDNNYSEVADAIKDVVVEFASFSNEQTEAARVNASAISKKALWSKFIKYYDEAYDMALKKAELRKNELIK